MPYSNKEKAKEYHRNYHLLTWPQRKSKHREAKQKRRINLATWLKMYKGELFCINCHENHPSCLDFHHISAGTKEGTIANMISEGYSIEVITKEIEKCIVLCKNCHAKKHYRAIEK